MGASWSVMLVTSFKDQGRERWPPDFGIDRKKWESNSFYIPGNIKIICVSLWQMSKRVQWVHSRQNKSRRGDWRTHAVSRFDRYLPWWGWWMCVSRRVDFTGEEKKDPGTRTSLNKKSLVRVRPVQLLGFNITRIPILFRPPLVHVTKKRRKTKIGKRTCTWYYILFFFWGAIQRVKGDKRWECRRTFPSPPPCWAFQCKCTCLAQ